MPRRHKVRALLLACWGLATLTGCGSRLITNTPRTATEQLLVSAAVEQAVSQLDFSFLEDRKVFLDHSLVDRVDKTFVVAEVRARARQAGIVLVDAADLAQYIIELRTGGVGTDQREYVFGIPAGQLPTIGGPIGIPEAPLYKSITQTGACRIAFVAYAREDGRFLYASGPAYGFSDHRSRWILGAGPGTQDNISPPKTPENTATARNTQANSERVPIEP